jgi:hypothetical protein
MNLKFIRDLARKYRFAPRVDGVTLSLIDGVEDEAQQASINPEGMVVSRVVIWDEVSGSNKLVTVGTTKTEILYLNGVTPGLASAGKALVVDAQKNITGTNRFGVNALYKSTPMFRWTGATNITMLDTSNLFSEFGDRLLDKSTRNYIPHTINRSQGVLEHRSVSTNINPLEANTYSTGFALSRETTSDDEPWYPAITSPVLRTRVIGRVIGVITLRGINVPIEAQEIQVDAAFELNAGGFVTLYQFSSDPNRLKVLLKFETAAGGRYLSFQIVGTRSGAVRDAAASLNFNIVHISG